MVNLLLVGPTCERVFGFYNLLKMILWTAIASSLAHMALGKAAVLSFLTRTAIYYDILIN